MERGDSESSLGKGRVLLFASGWHRKRASSLSRQNSCRWWRDHRPGVHTAKGWRRHGRQAGGIASRERFVFTTVHKPDGSDARLAEGTAFDQTDQPGVYQLGEGGRGPVRREPHRRREHTARSPWSSSEQLGVRLGPSAEGGKNSTASANSALRS
jgi:hypothetical protein